MKHKAWLFLSIIVILGLALTKLTSRQHLETVKTSRQPGAGHGAREPGLNLPNPILEIKSVIQHGDIFEIKGSVQPGVLVMINGERVPMLFDDPNFRYFVGPLSTQPAIVTTAQDVNGGVETKQLVLGERQ